MNQISFNCEKKTIITSLERLRKIIKPRLRMQAELEIRILPSGVGFHVIGAEEKIPCATSGYGSFVISLEYFYSIAFNHPKDLFNPVFQNQELHIGGLITKGLAFKIMQVHPENNFTPDLSLNFNDIDLLKMANNQEESQSEHMKKLIKGARQRLEKKIDETLILLKEYGITRRDIERMINRYIM